MATGAQRLRVLPVETAAGRRLFRAAGAAPYQRDSHWVPPLPGEERETFDPRRNPALDGVESRRWVLLDGDRPVGRVAAFAPAHRPGVGYIGFFETLPDPESARRILAPAEEWLHSLGRRECYGPIAVTPRDRLGLLLDGFEQPPFLFSPYNPPYYEAQLAAAGWSPTIFLRGYGWDPGYADPRGVEALARRAARGSAVRIRPMRLERLGAETSVVATLVNQTLAEAWHFDPISAREAADMARLLGPILDPEIALIAEDDTGPCGVMLGVPDVNWLWRRAGGRLFPFGWVGLLKWRRHIPQLRVMAMGLAPRVLQSGLAARLIHQILWAGRTRGYAHGEMSQIFDRNAGMRRILDRMEFPVVRRYAVFAKQLGG